MDDHIRIKLDRRLARGPETSHGADFSRAAPRETRHARSEVGHARLLRRGVLHVLVFIGSFIFSVGATALGILLWVTPGDVFMFVLVCLVASVVFVATFTALRMLVLHILTSDYPQGENPGIEHHLGKSVAYAFVALVFALLLAGIIIQSATANTFL